MNILITGASGFVGHHLAQHLASEGHTLMGLGHNVVPSVTYPYTAVDLLDATAVRQLDFSLIQGVIHLAGLAAVGPSFDNPRKYIDSNAGMQINLFESLLHQDVHPRVLVVSSGMLYQPDALPLTESSPVDTPNPYAVSKLTQEMLAQYYQKRGFEIIITRPFNHIGPGQSEGFLGADLAKQIIEAERAGQGDVRVGDLSARRDFTDVRDIVKAYALLLKSGTPGETYNVCRGTSHSGQEILESLLQNTTCEINIEADPAKMRPSEIPEFYGSHAKLTRDTGWEPIIPLEQTLKDMLSDWRARLSKSA